MIFVTGVGRTDPLGDAGFYVLTGSSLGSRFIDNTLLPLLQQMGPKISEWINLIAQMFS